MVEPKIWAAKPVAGGMEILVGMDGQEVSRSKATSRGLVTSGLRVIDRDLIRAFYATEKEANGEHQARDAVEEAIKGVATYLRKRGISLTQPTGPRAPGHNAAPETLGCVLSILTAPPIKPPNRHNSTARWCCRRQADGAVRRRHRRAAFFPL